MMGPYLLTEIDKQDIVRSPGVFILSSNAVNHEYIGRAENDLYSVIKYRWKTSLGYRYFWYELTPDEEAAYLLECKLYHQYMPSDNLIHPYPPEESNTDCPVEGCIWTL